MTNMKRIAVRFFLCWLAITCLAPARSSRADGRERPFLGAYLNIPRLFDASDSLPDRERAIGRQLDEFKASGLRVVMPYATTTSGEALYPSNVIPDKRYADWDPLAVVVAAAKARQLEVYPVACVLACGKDALKGILRTHQEWALRDEAGRPIGHISPCHPQARAWVTSVMAEIVDRYRPDGLLLDYLRFNNRPMQLDPRGAAELAVRLRGVSPENRPRVVQQFKEAGLTELMRSISVDVRRRQPGIRIAIYSWGPHVVENHRVAQDWETWAKRKYIDMVNVSGYCYRANYGDRYLQVFKERLAGALAINRRAGGPVDVTLCLGIRTSHGRIEEAAEVNDYLSIAQRLGVDGAAVFTWDYLRPYLDAISRDAYFANFAAGLATRQ